MQHSAETPEHVRIAARENKMPLVWSSGLNEPSDLKVAAWRGRLKSVRTRERGDYHTICFSKRGAFVRRLDKTAPALVSGGFFIQPAHAYGHFESNDVVEYVHLYLRVNSMEQIAAGFDLDPRCARDLPDAFGIRDPNMARMVRGCLNSLQRVTVPCRIHLDEWFQAFGSYLIRESSRLAKRATGGRTGALSAVALKRVLEAVEDNMERDVSLESLAKVCELSSWHFARAFKRSTGFSPHQYVLERRTDRARDLLLGSNATISEIAYSVGFASQGHMTDVFRERMGISPGAVRRQRAI